MIDGFQEGFLAEAQELLNSLEESLLALEDNPEDGELVAAVFRAMHTIKGSAGMFGFDVVAGFTHHVESALETVRSGKSPVTPSLIDLTLQCRDHIRALLDTPEVTSELDEQSKKLQRLLELEVSPPGTRDQSGPAKPVERRLISEDASVVLPADSVEQDRFPITWHIRFIPDSKIMANGTNPLLLLQELQEMGDCTTVAHTEGILPVDTFDLGSCGTSWDLFLTTTENENALRDVFMFVEDECELLIRKVDEIDFGDPQQYKRLGQILVERGVVEESVVADALAGQTRLGEVLRSRGVDAREIETALQEQEHARKARQKIQSESGAASIRVQSEKLDDLVDLVGELVTLQARLSQTAILQEESSLQAIAEHFERLIGELRDHTMSIRMLPISSTFSRFKRLVRDLARDLHKEVDLETEGGDTELDKTVIERLQDPLVHVIRNSIDHGVELPDQRVAAGKRRNGTVRLVARHTGANVEIRVEDDGKGLDRERIIAKAIKNGLISADTQLSDREVYDMVFMAGFSTAAEVTSVSGRGVGMDVVRREIDTIGGSVAVESTPGQGSAVVMTIPLTLAIIDGLLVRIADERFVIPLSNVSECVEYHRNGKKEGLLENRGELIPLMDLRSEFSIIGELPEIEQAVVVETGIGAVGFLVDAVIGDHQTVIKNLGQLYHHVEAVSGATILGDGTVALIIDVQRLVNSNVRNKRVAQ